LGFGTYGRWFAGPFLLDGDLFSPLEDLDEPAEVERVVVLFLRALGCFCGEGVGRGPRGMRSALPLFLITPGLVSSGSFFMFLINPEGEGPKLIPAAIAPSRFCKGACDLDPIMPSVLPRVPCSDLMRTDVGSVCIFGGFEQFFSLLISLPPDFLAIYSGDEDRVFRLCGEGDEPEVREEPEDLLLLSPFSLRPLLLC